MMLIELDSASPEAVDGRQIRAVTFHEVRMDYVTGVVERLGLAVAGSSALVIGGGRGVLPRGLARLGFDVVSVDPSEAATRMAVAEQGGIAYRTAPAEDPGLGDERFDIVYVADTFEITADLDRVIEQASRALTPDGVLFYDTVNRTLLSRLVYLGLFQGIPMTRIMPQGRYSADRLRTPAEIAAALERHGLHNTGVCDFHPKNAISLLKATLARRRGSITDDEIPPMVEFALKPGATPPVTYLGYAVAASSSGSDAAPRAN